MTDAREKLKAAIDSAFEAGWNAGVSSAEPDAFIPGTEEEDRLQAMKQEACDLLDAMPEGPVLPWVSVEERLPEFDDGGGWVLWLIDNNRSGKLLRTMEWHLRHSRATHWLPLSDVPLPTASGWIDAGVWHADEGETGGPYLEPGTLLEGGEWPEAILPNGRSLRVMVKPVEGEDG